MQSFTVDAKPTNKPTIFKFEVNVFLTKNNSFEFKNIEEAQISPLATKLFYLPFVKTVFISQNYIGIEKYNIAEWDDVSEDVSELMKRVFRVRSRSRKRSRKRQEKSACYSLCREKTHLTLR